MKCFNCNSEVDDNSKFCRYCGTRLVYSEETLSLEEDDVEVIKDEIVTSESQSQPNALSNETSAEYHDNSAKCSKTSNKHKLNKYIIVFFVIVVLIILILIIFRDQIKSFLDNLFKPIYYTMPDDWSNRN